MNSRLLNTINNDRVSCNAVTDAFAVRLGDRTSYRLAAHRF